VGDDQLKVGVLLIACIIFLKHGKYKIESVIDLGIFIGLA
jgi:hypothetical protein